MKYIVKFAGTDNLSKLIKLTAEATEENSVYAKDSAFARIPIKGELLDIATGCGGEFLENLNEFFKNFFDTFSDKERMLNLYFNKQEYDVFLKRITRLINMDDVDKMTNSLCTLFDACPLFEITNIVHFLEDEPSILIELKNSKLFYNDIF